MKFRVSIRAFSAIALIAWASLFSGFTGPDARAADSAIRVPYLTGPVVDEAELLSESQRETVAGVLRQIQKSGRAQIAVLIAGSLQGVEIESYSIAVAEQWKLGERGKDNGLILVIAPQERRMRIEVGYGLEGDLTDLESKRLIDRVLVPNFQEGRYFEGVLLAVSGIAQKLGVDVQSPAVQGVKRSHPARRQSRGMLFYLIVILILIFRTRSRWVGLGGFGGGMRGGGWGGGGGGGFSGGGGGFGGGGASGRW